MVTMQVPVPAQAPLHPLKLEPVDGTASSVTVIPAAKLSAQSAPQSTPEGVLVTLPAPVPFLVTLSANTSVNVAVTAFAESTVTMHVPDPVQAPAHPEKADPCAGDVDRATASPPG